MNTAEIIEHLEEQKRCLEAAIMALSGSPKIRRGGRRRFSAAARKRMSIAQKRRWKARRAKAKA